MNAAKIEIPFAACNNPSRAVLTANVDGKRGGYVLNTETGGLDRLKYEGDASYFGVSPCGKYAVFLGETKGNERGHFQLLEIESGKMVDLTPDLPEYYCQMVRFSQTGKIITMSVAYLTGKYEAFAIYLGDDGSVKGRKTLFSATTYLQTPATDPTETIAAFHGQERDTSGRNVLTVIDMNTCEVLAKLVVSEDKNLLGARFSKQAGKILGNSDERGGYYKPFVWDYRNDKREFLFSDIEGDVFFEDYNVDKDIALVSNFVGVTYNLYRYNLESGELVKLDIPSGVLTFAEIVGDEIWVLQEDSTRPNRYIALDLETGNYKRTILDLFDAPPSLKWKSVEFVGARGDKIQAWLSLPEGKLPCPTILHVHGGPMATQLERFQSDVWTDHGFAYFSINYHGSMLFGNEFKSSIDGQLGKLELEDMEKAYEYLVENGIAMPDKVVVHGGSYGGYLTLLSLTKKPDLFCAGIAAKPVADWKMSYEDGSPGIGKYLCQLHKGTPDENPDSYKQSSPLTYVENLKSPVLIISGENDIRTPKRQVEAFVNQAKELGKDIDIKWYDIGHRIFVDKQETVEMYELMVEWLYSKISN